MDESHRQHQALQELPPAVVKVRWKPNDEQLRMLVRLFEDEGDSINKQRIKEIALELARQGDVTEANVHNWFHNRKARAKRKQKLMQQNDGESEVDTDDVDSKAKRSKLEHHHHHVAATATKVTNSSPSAPPNGTLFLPEFAQPEPQQGFMAGFPMRQPLRLPSDAVNLNSRMYESSLMINPHHHHQNLAPPPPPPPPAPHHHHHQHHQAAAHGVIDKFRVAPYTSQEIAPPETHLIDWRPHHQLALMPSQAGTDLQDRSSESKTITDDASTESEDISDSRAWSSKPQPVKKSWKKRAKGTMIRKPLAAAAAVASAGNGRASRNHHSSSSTRKRRIREILKGLKKSNPDSYERDLKALFVEVVRKIGGNKARSILNRLTRPDSDTSTSSSSGSQAMDSGSCSSTASLPRQARRVSSSSPSDYNTGTNNATVRGGDHFYSDPYGRVATMMTAATTATTTLPAANEQAGSFYHQTPSSHDHHHHQQHQSSVSMWDPSARHELTLSTCSKQYQQRQQSFQQQGSQEKQPGFRGSKSSSSTEDDNDDDEDTNDANNGDETDDDNKEEYRIVYKKQQQQQDAFTTAAVPQSFESRCEEATPSTPVAPVTAAAPTKKEKPLKQQQQQQQPRLELAPEGEKTNVTLNDGKPSGAIGTWWNAVLRQAALLFLDVSIPHIALQPEEGMVRIRDYMDSKFTYVGGTLDDAYLKKQVAKALNFRRHKVMRMIEQGSGRPSDVSQEQWDSLIKYYADPKRREKSDKQRAALKALNMNNQQQQQQQFQQQVQVQVQQQQLQQQQQQIQSPHASLNLNMSIHTQSGQEQDDGRLNLAGDEADEDDDGEEDDEEDTEDEQVAPAAP